MLLIIMTGTNISCRKDRGFMPEDALNERNLTLCPERSNCKYVFDEYPFTEAKDGIVKQGFYRMYWASVERQGQSLFLVIEPRTEGDAFFLSNEQIVKGFVKVIFGCPTCNSRFWTMLAQVQGGMTNASQIAKSLDVTLVTISRYLDLMIDLLLVRRL